MWIKIVKEFKPLSSNVHSLKDKEKKRRKGGEPHTRTHTYTHQHNIKMIQKER